MERRPSETEIDWASSMIFECMAKGVSKRQAVAFFEANWGVPPMLTETIWDMIQEEVRGAFVHWDTINNEGGGTHQENPVLDVPVPGYRRQQQHLRYVGGGYYPQNDQTYLETQGWNSNAAGRRRLQLHNTTIPTPSN